MKNILIATVALGIFAAPALAAGFPEKAESRVWTESQSNFAGDAMVKLPLKRADRIHSADTYTGFGSTQPLAVGTSSSHFIYSPNR